MKKILIIVLCAIMLLSFTACNNQGFLSAGKTKALLKDVGGKNPQAQMTLTFKAGSGSAQQTVTLEIVYEILLDKTPITAVNFINAVQDGFYNNVLVHTNQASYNYMVAGGYYRKDTTSTNDKGEEVTTSKYYKQEIPAFLGEIAGNGFAEPEGEKVDGDSYTKFDVFSLAMFHADGTNYFNSADGKLVIATSSQIKLSHLNYAVFAKMVSIVVKVDGQQVSTEVENWVLAALKGCTATTKRNIYDKDDVKQSAQVSILSPDITIDIKMLGDIDWSVLPTITL